MSTVVYRGLPSFLESQLNESRTLRLRLASPRSHLSHSFEMAICSVLDSDSKVLYKENSLNSGDPLSFKFNNPTTETSSKPQPGGLSFLQTLPSICQAPVEKQSSYVHPLVKRASSMLSDKSLELCTENLGSESGTDIIEDENNIFSPICSDTDIGNHSTKVHPKKRHVASSRRTAPKTFPPPLSTITGSDAVQVRPIRENGRLVLQAVKVQPKVSCFQAERSNGRLRLRLLEHASTSSSDLDATEDECIGIGTTRDDNYHANDESECDSNNSSERQQEPEIRRESSTRGDMVNNSTVVGTSSGSGNVEWQGSCEDGRHGNTEAFLLDWESFWVATS